MSGLELSVPSRLAALHHVHGLCQNTKVGRYLTISSPQVGRLHTPGPAWAVPSSQLLAHCHLDLYPSPTAIIIVPRPAAAFHPNPPFISSHLGTQPSTGEAVTPNRIGWALVITMPSHIVWPDSSDTTSHLQGCRRPSGHAPVVWPPSPCLRCGFGTACTADYCWTSKCRSSSFLFGRAYSNSVLLSFSNPPERCHTTGHIDGDRTNSTQPLFARYSVVHVCTRATCCAVRKPDYSAVHYGLRAWPLLILTPTLALALALALALTSHHHLALQSPSFISSPCPTLARDQAQAKPSITADGRR